MAENQGNLESRIEVLLNVEKKMRLAEDVGGVKKVVCDILQLCFESKAWKTLNDQTILLSKHRGQLKQLEIEKILAHLVEIEINKRFG